MNAIPYLDVNQLKEKLPWLALIKAIDAIFTSDVIEPLRHQHDINVPNEPTASILLKPAWIEGEYLGVKQVAIFPGNNTRGLPGLNSSYLLSSAKTGEPLLQLDADELTARRTAAASALASRYLSRIDSSKLLMIGSGRLAKSLVEAHQIVRPISEIQVWSRNQSSAQKIVDELISEGKKAVVCSDENLPQQINAADIISCATMSTQPIVLGQYLNEGTHLDLVGAFTPKMRETDDETIQKSSVFVDTRAGALSEAGDLTQAMQSGVFTSSQVVAELSELSAKLHAGRSQLSHSESQITLFKSVGAGREDLAAAILAYQALAL
ncbi:UNVERIFIED_CONTAM: hypothetical protein GTU68_016948 [Idotea baltica]|nr:hypothetical protein [Idotea baltica]